MIKYDNYSLYDLSKAGTFDELKECTRSYGLCIYTFDKSRKNTDIDWGVSLEAIDTLTTHNPNVRFVVRPIVKREMISEYDREYIASVYNPDTYFAIDRIIGKCVEFDSPDDGTVTNLVIPTNKIESSTNMAVICHVEKYLLFDKLPKKFKIVKLLDELEIEPSITVRDPGMYHLDRCINIFIRGVD